MSCVSLLMVSVLHNGSAMDPFTPTRGIRQRYPLSPHLFILCMERLSRDIDTIVQMRASSPIKIYPRGPSISHLICADEIILCTKINITSCQVVANTLYTYSVASGQMINFSKSYVFFLKNKTQSTKDFVSA